MNVRVGIGYDIHRLVEGRQLRLGGVLIPFELGLLGHSDADVLLHAISDAVLGAASLGDIGQHFPDTDAQFKDANSLDLLRTVASLVWERGWRVLNVDSVVIAEVPKLAPYVGDMSNNIAGALRCENGCVGVKATTNEGMGVVGSRRAIAAYAVVLLGR